MLLSGAHTIGRCHANYTGHEGNHSIAALLKPSVPTSVLGLQCDLWTTQGRVLAECVYVYMYVCLYVYMYVCVLVCVCMYTCIYVRANTIIPGSLYFTIMLYDCMCESCMHANKPPQLAYSWTTECVHAFSFKHTDAHMHAHTHTHTHTYTCYVYLVRDLHVTHSSTTCGTYTLLAWMVCSSSASICMYVCMYVCMWVCMYVCTHVRMYV